jgi:hypothetical protein
MTAREKQIYDKFNQMGWVAYHYPRLKVIAINGGKRLPVREAVKVMEEAIARREQSPRR